MSKQTFEVGVDIGGTFTDLVAIDNKGERIVVKTPSTPADPSQGMINALRQAAEILGIEFRDFLGKVSRICHGTTVTTNAVIVRSGSKVGMLTTKGVRDIIEVRKGMRELDYLYDYTWAQPEPLCPRNLRKPIAERVDATGAVLTPMNEDDVRAAVRSFKKEGVDAVAICFLWSIRNPTHELRAAEICREELPDAYLSLSHKVAPVLGEYLRFQTTTVNSYVGPIIQNYMTVMEETLKREGYDGPLLIVTSSGGVMSTDSITKKAVVTLTSGPASGPVAGMWYGRQYGMDSLITIDMGGTSFDTALVRNGEVSIRSEQVVAGVYHLSVPTVDIHVVGAGGGTIAWLDEAGGIHVGPQSAGADPGPACYMKGGIEPTVTDANLVLGRINPDYFVGGSIKLDKEAAIKAIEKIAKLKGMTIEEMANAIVTISNVIMSDAIGVITVQRGENPKDYGLLVGGGAGPGVGALLAQMMGIRKVIVPRESSVFCAMGGIISDVRHDYLTTIARPVADMDFNELNVIFKKMRREADAILTSEGVPEERRYYRYSADMKYVGQFHEIDVAWPEPAKNGYTNGDTPEIERRFHERHETLFAHHDELERVFVANLKLAAFGGVAEVMNKKMPVASGGAATYRKVKRPVWFADTGSVASDIYDGDAMGPGAVVEGPCIIEQKTTTILVPPQFTAEVTEYGDFLINVPA